MVGMAATMTKDNLISFNSSPPNSFFPSVLSRLEQNVTWDVGGNGERIPM